jgi:adenylate cyclase class 2
MTEIELKAHVKNLDTVKSRLETLAVYKGSFEKEDAYWFPQTAGSPLPPSGLRVRKEKDRTPEGTVSAVVHVTYKIKEVREGMEINDEKEFELSQAAEFEDLITMLGLKKGREKTKKGFAYACKRINAELCEVEGLGWFIELEILSENRDRAAVDRARKELLGFLGALGIGEEALESRYYTEMLGDVPVSRGVL